jgi:hypothetical protein
MHALAAVALASLLAACSPAGRPVLAEVLYDASGDDTDREFVELLNPLGVATPLLGLRLEAGDGAGPNRWTLRWAGTARDSIAPHARFVIGGALVSPTPDAIATLDLQNGPDAVRLVWPDGAIEVLGYGQPLAAEYFCGAPALDAPAGFSLARMPDDADHGSNATDFVPAVPSPGAANQVAVDVACVRGSLALVPERPAAYGAARLSCGLENRGTAPLAGGAAALIASEQGAPLARAPAPALAAGESVRVALDLPGLAAGRHALEIRAALPGDQRAANDADTLVMRCGPGPLVITEIQFHPAAGEGEWVEVRADSDRVVPGDFSLSDRTGAAVALPASAPPFAIGEYALLAQNRAALLAHFATLDGSGALDSTRVFQLASWDALNNSDGESGTADAAVLRGPGALPCDRVEYSARGVPSGEPIERGDLGWGIDSDPAGTPLAPPRQLLPLASRFTVTPRRVTAGVTPRLGWMLPWPRARLSVEVFDLAGRRVTSEPGRLVSGRGESRLEGLPGPGVYLVALHAVEESGAGVIQEARVIRLEAGR